MNSLVLKSVIIVGLIALIAGSAIASPDIVGNWDGKIFFSPSSSAKIELNLNRDSADNLVGIVTAVGQTNSEYKVQNIQIVGKSVSFEMNDGRTTASFSGNLTADGTALEGDFSQAGQLFPFELSRKVGTLSSQKNESTDRN